MASCGTLDLFAPVFMVSPYMCGPDFWAMGCRKNLSRYQGLPLPLSSPRAPQFSAESENAIVLVRISNRLKMRNADLVDSITVDLFCKGTGTELAAHGSQQVRKYVRFLHHLLALSYILVSFS
jgi:hypothetical protein